MEAKGKTASVPEIDLYFEIVDGKRVTLDAGSTELARLGAMIATVLYKVTFPNAPGVILYKPLIKFTPTESRRPSLASFGFAALLHEPARAKSLMQISEKKSDLASTDLIPDAAIEIIAPTTTIGFVHERTSRYLNAGVRQVWHVYPTSKRINVFDSPKTAIAF